LASALNAVINAKHFIDKVRYKTVVRKGTTRQLHECVVSELICTCSCFVSQIRVK
jgi:glycine cleavage system protein P-like pyridoxal-binding family